MKYDDEVHAGIELLDFRYPGWRDRIVLDELHMGDVDRCVLGQVYGDYDEGLKALWPGQFTADGRTRRAREHAFEKEANTSDAWQEPGPRYAVLTRARKRAFRELGIGR